MKARTLYHWTHADNLPSIRVQGLDPIYATGKLRAVWCCGGKRLLWAAGHVAAAHGWEPDDMVLLVIDARYVTARKTSMGHVYTVPHNIPPVALMVSDGLVLNDVTPIRDV